LKNKNNFEIKNSFFHRNAENFSDHPRISLTLNWSQQILTSVAS